MSEPNPVLEYQEGVRTQVGVWAVFWLALAGAAGFFLIVPAVVVFFASLIVRNVVPARDTKGQTLATAAVWVSFCSAGAGLLFWVFMPSLGHNHHHAPRSTCAANLRGIMQSLVVYSADNGDAFPVVGDSYSSTLVGTKPWPTGPEATLLSGKPGGLYAGVRPGNVSQSMWLLVLNGQVAAKQFLCRDDPAHGVAAPREVPGRSDCYSNFSNDKAYSYSFAFMWDGTGKVGGWWRNDMDAGLPLMADMAPANGTGRPKANTLVGANSFNHRGDGQNVGFGDAHAEFVRMAAVGHRSDNIYSANGAGGPSATGIWASSAGDPGILGGKAGDWDVVLVPAGDGGSGVRK